MNSIPICSEGCAHFISTLKNKHDSYSQTKIYVQTIVWIYIIDFFFLVCSTINHRIIQKIIYFKYPASQPLSILHLLNHPPPLTCASTCLTIHSSTHTSSPTQPLSHMLTACPPTHPYAHPSLYISLVNDIYVTLFLGKHGEKAKLICKFKVGKRINYMLFYSLLIYFLRC